MGAVSVDGASKDEVSLDDNESSLSEDFDREAEIELKPGIPVVPVLESFEHSGSVSLRDDEIEDVIEVLDAPFPEEDDSLEAADDETSSGEDELESLVTADEEVDLDESREIDEPVEDVEEAALEESDEIGEGEADPSWVYQPSEGVPSPARSKRWAAAGVAVVAVIGLAAGVLFLFGTGGNSEAPSRNDALAAETEVPDVLAPAAFTPPPASHPEPQSAPSSASLGERTPTQEPPAAEAPAPRSVEKPARERPATPSRSLASPAAGSIFSSGSWKAGRRLLENGSYEEAARRFQSAVSGRPGLYTVQLALACEPQTIARAFRTTTGASDFFILPTTYQGRSCYRLVWGAYQDKSAAIAAKRSVPASFLQDPNPPKVAPI